MTITLAHYLVLGAILFAISVVGIFLNRRNVIILLMAIELMLLAVNMNFVAFSHYLGDMAGQVFVFFILTVAAAEAAIGLAILVVLFRLNHRPSLRNTASPAARFGHGWFIGNPILWKSDWAGGYSVLDNFRGHHCPDLVLLGLV